MKKVIFWDFDGTLVKSNQSFLDSLMKAAGDLDLPLSREAAGGFLKNACSWNRPEEVYPDAAGEAWWETLLGKLQKFSTEIDLPVEKIPELFSRFRTYAVSYPYALYEDALETLENTQAMGYENWILSNNFPELTETIHSLGLSPYIEEVFLSSCLGAEKPNRLLFEKALETAGSPKKAIMIGDNPVADMEGAKALGLATILVHRDLPCPAADRRVMQLRDIPEILQE